MATEDAKVVTDNTMQATVKEGIKTDPKLVEETKTVTKEVAENGAGDAPTAENGDQKNTKESENGDKTHADGEAPAQEAEVNQPAEENGDSDEKVAPKRPADGPEPETDDAKKQKTESENSEVTEEPAKEEQKAE